MISNTILNLSLRQPNWPQPLLNKHFCIITHPCHLLNSQGIKFNNTFVSNSTIRLFFIVCFIIFIVFYFVGFTITR